MYGKINLGVHQRLSFLSGLCYPMPENFDKRSRCFRFLWTAYVHLPHIVMIVELISQVIQIYLSFNNVETVTTCTLSTVYVAQFLGKIAVFKKNEKTFVKTFKELSAISESLMNNPMGDRMYPQFHDNYYSVVKKIGIFKGTFQLASNLGLFALFITLSWVGLKRDITPAFSWTPFDSTKNPVYTYLCFFEMVCYGSVTARSGVLDLLFWVMIVVPTVQLSYLKHLMDIIMNDNEKRKSNIVSSAGTDNGEVEDDGGGSDDQDKVTLTSRMNWWIQHHQKILKNIMEFRGLASAFLGVNYLSSLIDLFMSGFVAISQSSKWDIFQRILINAIIIMDALQLYFISLAGDWLRDGSENVADLGFTGILFSAKKSIRQNYLFTLTRTRRCIQFRFAGVNPLSTQTFSRLIQLTMSYFITVVQLRNSKLNPSEAEA